MSVDECKKVVTNLGFVKSQQSLTDMKLLDELINHLKNPGYETIS